MITPNAAPNMLKMLKSTICSGLSRKKTAITYQPGANSGTNQRIEQQAPE